MNSLLGIPSFISQTPHCPNFYLHFLRSGDLNTPGGRHTILEKIAEKNLTRPDNDTSNIIMSVPEDPVVPSFYDGSFRDWNIMCKDLDHDTMMINAGEDVCGEQFTEMLKRPLDVIGGSSRLYDDGVPVFYSDHRPIKSYLTFKPVVKNLRIIVETVKKARLF